MLGAGRCWGGAGCAPCATQSYSDALHCISQPYTPTYLSRLSYSTHQQSAPNSHRSRQPSAGLLAGPPARHWHWQHLSGPPSPAVHSLPRTATQRSQPRTLSQAYDYTAKGHLVGVITNGTAVLGLGNIGALAGKPVMEVRLGMRLAAAGPLARGRAPQQPLSQWLPTRPPCSFEGRGRCLVPGMLLVCIPTPGPSAHPWSLRTLAWKERCSGSW